MNVFIVDDDEEENEVLSGVHAEMLPATICYFAETAARCLTLIKELPVLDYIFLDSHLPDMPSLECLRKVIAEPKLADTKIILYAGSAGMDLEQRSLEAGAHYFLEKPGSLGELRDALRGDLSDWYPDLNTKCINRGGRGEYAKAAKQKCKEMQDLKCFNQIN